MRGLPAQRTPHRRRHLGADEALPTRPGQEAPALSLPPGLLRAQESSDSPLPASRRWLPAGPPARPRGAAPACLLLLPGTLIALPNTPTRDFSNGDRRPRIPPLGTIAVRVWVLSGAHGEVHSRHANPAPGTRMLKTGGTDRPGPVKSRARQGAPCGRHGAQHVATSFSLEFGPHSSAAPGTGGGGSLRVVLPPLPARPSSSRPASTPASRNRARTAKCSSPNAYLQPSAFGAPRWHPGHPTIGGRRRLLPLELSA